MDENLIAAICIFGLAPALIFSYLIFTFIMKNKERMAMIEKGILPIREEKQERPQNNIKGAFMSAGAGLGVLIGYLIQKYLGMEEPFGYLSMAFLFGGVSLIIYYVLLSKGKFSNN